MRKDANVVITQWVWTFSLPSLTVSYRERQKDASYITVSSRPTPDSEPGARIVKSMSIRAAIAKGQIVRLEESSKTGEPVKPAAFEVNKFFRRLSFKHQVRSLRYKSGGRTVLFIWDLDVHWGSVWVITLGDESLFTVLLSLVMSHRCCHALCHRERYD